MLFTLPFNYSIVLNVFISSVCQNQTRPYKQFCNLLGLVLVLIT
nr:MAG TPA: hypothetical protein [Caudoviricetes sp.]